MPTKSKRAQRKKPTARVRDLKPTKSAKGGGIRLAGIAGESQALKHKGTF
jgi:hypothetical protein